MTVLALARDRLIENNRFAGHFAGQLVAGQARHVSVSPIERVSRPLVMVKLSRFPARGVMATRAVGGIRPGSKLLSVWILMASGAHFRSGCEIHILQGHLHRRRSMAIKASNPAVHACERKFSRRMVEAR